MSRRWSRKCAGGAGEATEVIGWLGASYPWIKAAHLIFVIFWMAGLFLLPRFLVYHQEAVPTSREARDWVEREARLIAIILKPATIAVWALGLALVTNIGAGTETWFRLKFVLVVALTAYQFWMIDYARRLERGEARVANKTLRLINEVPGVATIAIVLLVIVKPFGG